MELTCSYRKDKMALLVDKYRPRSLEALTYHENLSERLRSLVRPFPWSATTLLTVNLRRKAETSPISWFTDRQARERRRE